MDDPKSRRNRVGALALIYVVLYVVNPVCSQRTYVDATDGKSAGLIEQCKAALHGCVKAMVFQSDEFVTQRSIWVFGGVLKCEVVFSVGDLKAIERSGFT